ncbi:MAG: hypothetical protein CVV21_04975 [Candidatus Goldiibacteriota bacterium HGW-Goldbacteria-1]|jgi:CheY-like chemotaxis protein|nr:MAG: hypothetical protein CVV21_04975 [Candidatus Goldiibacteriota bacterium HGW-Goldbacteria-1]
MVKKTVLITDDEKDMREELSTILKGEGYMVMQAANGREAIDLIKKHKIDVMLLDLKMPVMTGFDVLKVLEAEKNTIRTIVLTGSILGSTLPDKDDLSYAEKTKILKFADIVLNKPFDVVKLLGKISMLAGQQ